MCVSVCGFVRMCGVCLAGAPKYVSLVGGKRQKEDNVGGENDGRIDERIEWMDERDEHACVRVRASCA
jgi:hypothetical protein